VSLLCLLSVLFSFSGELNTHCWLRPSWISRSLNSIELLALWAKRSCVEIDSFLVVLKKLLIHVSSRELTACRLKGLTLFIFWRRVLVTVTKLTSITDCVHLWVSWVDNLAEVPLSANLLSLVLKILCLLLVLQSLLLLSRILWKFIKRSARCSKNLLLSEVSAVWVGIVCIVHRLLELSLLVAVTANLSVVIKTSSVVCCILSALGVFHQVWSVAGLRIVILVRSWSLVPSKVKRIALHLLASQLLTCILLNVETVQVLIRFRLSTRVTSCRIMTQSWVVCCTLDYLGWAWTALGWSVCNWVLTLRSLWSSIRPYQKRTSLWNLDSITRSASKDMRVVVAVGRLS